MIIHLALLPSFIPENKIRVYKRKPNTLIQKLPSLLPSSIAKKQIRIQIWFEFQKRKPNTVTQKLPSLLPSSIAKKQIRIQIWFEFQKRKPNTLTQKMPSLLPSSIAKKQIRVPTCLNPRNQHLESIPTPLHSCSDFLQITGKFFPSPHSHFRPHPHVSTHQV